MAFSYDGRNLPRITNYTLASDVLDRAPRWKNQTGDYDERALDTKRKKHVTIRKLRDNSIACRLHNTDVITFHPDNTMTVKPWSSISTDEFFNSLIGANHGILAWFNTGLIRVQDKFYIAYDELKIDCASGRLLSEPRPFRISTINRKKSGEVRKLYSYQDFATWVKMMAAMNEIPPRQNRMWVALHDVCSMMQDRNDWPALMLTTDYPPRVDVIGTLNRVREGIYDKHPEVYDVKVRPHLATWQEVRQWKRR